MPPKIYSIKEPLNLENVRLAKPTNKNGSYFIKILNVDNPIYFLSPKCFVKQGFVKSGKKIFCDLVFSNDDSDFLAWLENLEETSRKSIYSNRETWFETPLEEHDIESSMSPPYKPYKSGKYFIVRANVPTALDKINIKIYDENEEETDPENIKENTKVLAVLEFQGIRCSVRSFQFEIELKQMLVVEPEKLFEKCIIGTGLSKQSQVSHGSPIRFDNHPNAQNATYSKPPEVSISEEPEPIQEYAEPLVETNVKKGSDKNLEEPEDQIVEGSISTDQPQPINVENAPTEFSVNTDSDSTLIEIIDDNFPLENIAEFNTEKEPPLRLKSRNDVYYKLYKETRQRAREAKRTALANYLEAKRIKNTYLLEDLSDSDSDEDNLEDMNLY
jgi:hypothetical protein